MRCLIRADRRLVFGLLFCLSIFGCTFKKMLYENLDRVALYQIDSYLDLSGEQEKSIRDPVHQLIRWVKKEKLPEVIMTFEGLEKQAAAKAIDGKTLSFLTEKFKTWRDELAQRLAQPTAHLLKSLDADQIDHLRKKMEKSNQALQKLLDEKPQDFDEELQDYAEDQLKKYKHWYGDFTPAQSKLLISSMRYSRASLTMQLEQRRRVQAYFLEQIAQRDEKGLASLLQSWGSPDSQWLDTGYQQSKAQGREQWKEFWVALHRSLSAQQWEHLRQRLAETRKDLEGLAKVESPS